MPTGSQDQTEIEEENPRAVMPQIDSFRLAFHNVALLVFTLLCAGAIAAAYNLFSDFMKPLIWAVICGIVLYPLKREMTTVVTNWLDDLIDNSTPVLISLVFMPIRLINSLGDWMFDTIIGHKLPVALIAISIPVSSLVLQNGFLPSTLLMITKLLRVIDLTVGLLPHSSMVRPICLVGTWHLDC